MMNSLDSAIKLASSGLFAQAQRIQVVSENIANASSTGTTPGADPYQRKTISFEADLDQLGGASAVRVGEIGTDTSDFKLEYAPSHPAADANGYVKMPNVEMTTELADMREASRSYQANIQVIKQARDLVAMTINMLGAS